MRNPLLRLIVAACSVPLVAARLESVCDMVVKALPLPMQGTLHTAAVWADRLLESGSVGMLDGHEPEQSPWPGSASAPMSGVFANAKPLNQNIPLTVPSGDGGVMTQQV